MDDRQGNTFSFQLTTKDTEDLSQVERIETGRYEQQLTPPVFVPFNATPTVALYDLTFANTMANIAPEHKNDTLVLGWGGNVNFGPAADKKVPETPYATDTTFTEPTSVNSSVTLKIPKGNYTLSDLEVAIAKELLKTAVVPIPLNDGTRGGKTNPGDIWNQMEHYATEGLAFKADDDFVKGVANPNVPAQFSAGTAVVNTTPPVTFDELQERLKGRPFDGDYKDRYVKPVTLRANPQTNRLEVIILGPGEFRTGSTLATKVLGFDESQLATDTNHWQTILHSERNIAGALTFDRGWDGKTTSTSTFQQAVRDKQKPQRLDSSRVINFHLPGLVKGSYDRNGNKGNGRVATVPITVPPGAVEQWQVSTPLYMPCDVAGAYINSIVWFITNEEGDTIDLQGGRMSATVIVQWPAVAEGPVPPSSLAARTDPNIVRMPWSGTL